MSYVYLLAGENLEMAEAELNGFLKSQNTDEKAERNGRLAETDSEPGQLKRLALVHEVGEKLHEGGIEEFDPEDLPEGSFKVRTENLGETEVEGLESELGEIISSEERTVDLENPDETYRVYVQDERTVICRTVEDIDRSLFEDRSNEKRKFSSPVSLDPVLARVMVNLAEVPAGEHVVDPFCGTGGILIEAGLCGIGVHGSDVSDEMVEGTRKNLEEYGIIVHDIRKSGIQDAPELFDEDFSAVITDLPYGKSSKVEGDPVGSFIDNIEDFSDMAVFCYNEPEVGGMESDFEVYIHSNMSRYIFVQDLS